MFGDRDQMANNRSLKYRGLMWSDLWPTRNGSFMIEGPTWGLYIRTSWSRTFYVPPAKIVYNSVHQTEENLGPVITVECITLHQGNWLFLVIHGCTPFDNPPTGDLNIAPCQLKSMICTYQARIPDFSCYHFVYFWGRLSRGPLH